MRKLEYIVESEDEGLIIRDIVRKKMHVSRNLYTVLKREDSIIVDGKKVKPYTKPTAGQKVILYLPEDKNDFLPVNKDFEIVYEDEFMLVVNKDPYYVVHPTKSNQENTLANFIQFYQNEKDEHYKIRFVSRLDRDTSGLVIIAKTSHVHAKLSSEFKSDSFVKIYHLLVEGHLEKSEGIIDLPIAHLNLEGYKREVHESGKHSETHFKVLKEFNNCTLVEAKLITGRTHQLRVHFSHIGNPIIGDSLYNKDSNIIERQFLHAFSLDFKHPVSGKCIHLEAVYKKDMIEALESIEKE